MAHEHIRNVVEAKEGRAGTQIIATLVGGVLLLTSYIAELTFDRSFHAQALAFIAALLLGVPLIWQAVRDLLVGHMHMNELAALAVLAAFASGNFAAAGAVAFFMLIAVLIERRTALGAEKSIESLIRITPTQASKVSDDGEVKVEAKDLAPGDVVRVRPGDNIPGDGRIIHFTEKPARPTETPGRPGYCFCSMGVYVFKTEVLVREVIADAKTDTAHDFGRNVIPSMVERDRVFAHEFAGPEGRPEPYWRDIGTLDAYWEANHDLVQVQPAFNLYDADWPIRTYQPQTPPAKTVFNEPDGRQGRAMNSLVSAGTIISGAYIQDSILSPNVHVHTGADVRECVVMEDVDIGRGARLRRTIIDKHVRIPEGMVIGYDPEHDASWFTVSDGGVVVVPAGMALETG